MEWMALLLFATVIVALLAGFPVAFTLGGARRGDGHVQ